MTVVCHLRVSQTKENPFETHDIGYRIEKRSERRIQFPQKKKKKINLSLRAAGSSGPPSLNIHLESIPQTPIFVSA